MMNLSVKVVNLDALIDGDYVTKVMTVKMDLMKETVVGYKNILILWGLDQEPCSSACVCLWEECIECECQSSLRVSVTGVVSIDGVGVGLYFLIVPPVAKMQKNNH